MVGAESTSASDYPDPGFPIRRFPNSPTPSDDIADPFLVVPRGMQRKTLCMLTTDENAAKTHGELRSLTPTATYPASEIPDTSMSTSSTPPADLAEPKIAADAPSSGIRRNRNGLESRPITSPRHHVRCDPSRGYAARRSGLAVRHPATRAGR